MKDIREKKCYLIVDLSKFTFTKKMLSVVVAKLYPQSYLIIYFVNPSVERDRRIHILKLSHRLGPTMSYPKIKMYDN